MRLLIVALLLLAIAIASAVSLPAPSQPDPDACDNQVIAGDVVTPTPGCGSIHLGDAGGPAGLLFVGSVVGLVACAVTGLLGRLGAGGSG